MQSIQSLKKGSIDQGQKERYLANKADNIVAKYREENGIATGAERANRAVLNRLLALENKIGKKKEHLEKGRGEVKELEAQLKEHSRFCVIQ